MVSNVQSILGNHTDCFATFGLIAFSYVSLKLASSLWSGLTTFILAGKVDLKKYGAWAVVTGATDGIGKAYAQELAKQGLNIVLISRTLEKLNDVATEIVRQSSVQTKIIAVDFTAGPEIYAKIRRETEGLEIGVLVNNVGMGYRYPKYYAELTEEETFIQDMINININSVTMMTGIFLPRMAERKKGVIINIASASGAKPTPMLSLYSGTKVFVDFFSQALQKEYQSKGIIVQCVLPFFVATKMSKIRKPTTTAPSPESFVQSALKTVGRQTRTFGCLPHAVQGWVVDRVPSWLYYKVSTGTLMSARNRALKRAAAKKE